MRFQIMLVFVCLALLQAGTSQAQTQRTITTTGFAIQEFDPDWVRFALHVRLEGAYNKRLQNAVQVRADSLLQRIEKIAPDCCSVTVNAVREWEMVSYRRNRERYNRRGAKLEVQFFVTAIEVLRSIQQEVAEWAECQLVTSESGLLADSAAVRIVSEMAIGDAKSLAITGAAQLNLGLGELLSMNLNPAIEMDRPSGCGGSARALYDQFYSRGQIHAGRDRSKVIRRAIVIATFAMK